jgi:hypothetical protein
MSLPVKLLSQGTKNKVGDYCNKNGHNRKQNGFAGKLQKSLPAVCTNYFSNANFFCSSK